MIPSLVSLFSCVPPVGDAILMVHSEWPNMADALDSKTNPGVLKTNRLQQNKAQLADDGVPEGWSLIVHA